MFRTLASVLKLNKWYKDLVTSLAGNTSFVWPGTGNSTFIVHCKLLIQHLSQVFYNRLLNSCILHHLTSDRITISFSSTFYEPLTWNNWDSFCLWLPINFVFIMLYCWTYWYWWRSRCMDLTNRLPSWGVNPSLLLCCQQIRWIGG